MSVSGDDARCPRCGATFRCGAGDAAPCACAAVALDAATLAGLRVRFSGCLCPACLRALARAGPAAACAGSGLSPP